MSKYQVLMMHCQVLCAEKLHLKSQLHYSLVKGSTIPNERNLAQWKRGNHTKLSHKHKSLIRQRVGGCGEEKYL
jgi:polygalacturonase